MRKASFSIRDKKILEFASFVDYRAPFFFSFGNSISSPITPVDKEKSFSRVTTNGSLKKLKSFIESNQKNRREKRKKKKKKTIISNIDFPKRRYWSTLHSRRSLSAFPRFSPFHEAFNPFRETSLPVNSLFYLSHLHPLFMCVREIHSASVASTSRW